tara:strand:+ start:347 stop:1846 length:1500 start_codon:yes stop_codon:yes gene_type:complete
VKVILQIEIDMKDWNSITVDRYYEQLRVPSTVAIGILNISRDINSKIVNKRTLDMTYFYINRMVKAGLCDYIGSHNSVKDILDEAVQKGKKYCMIACQGLLLFRGQSLIVQSLEYAKKNPNFFVIAHVMDKKGQHHFTTNAYPGLHRQYLFVNLDTWNNLGKPPFDEIGFFWDRKQNLKNYKLSAETIHSNYTPAWIESAKGSTKHVITSDGSNWIDIACKKNIRIDNLDNDMRACKVFLYPYSDTEKLESVWYNKQSSTVDKLTNQSQRGWIRKLAYQEEIEKDRVYAFNTETLSGEGVRTTKPIDALFSAAAGFKPLAILNANGFHEGTQIHYFDWCEASLNYKKHLLETWDGYDLHEWLLEHDLEYNFSSAYRGNYESFWQQEVAEHGGREAFKTLWDRYKNLKHEFHIIDIVNESSKLFDKISSITGTTVLWTTNIWSSEMLHWNIEPEVLEEKWKAFELLIPEDLILYGHDYVAVDMRERVRNGKQTTHPRFGK